MMKEMTAVIETMESRKKDALLRELIRETTALESILADYPADSVLVTKAEQDARDAVGRLEQAVRMFEYETRELRDTVGSLKEKSVKDDRKIADLEASLSRAGQEYEDVMRDLDRAQEELARLGENVKRLETENTFLRRENEQIKMTVQSRDAAIAEQNDLLKQLGSKYEETVRENRSLQQTSEKNARAVAGLNATIDEMRMKLDQVVKERDEAKASFTKIQGQWERFTRARG